MSDKLPIMGKPRRDTCAKDVRVEQMHGRILVYDRYGRGHIELNESDAERVRDELTNLLNE